MEKSINLVFLGFGDGGVDDEIFYTTFVNGDYQDLLIVEDNV